MPYKKLDRSQLKTLPLSLRENKMTVADVMPLTESVSCDNPDIRSLAFEIVEARRRGSEVIWLMGAHVLRQGTARFILDLMERRLITHIAVNGAVAIHDFEMAYQGATLEDVEFYIRDGRFGNWEETGRFINQAVIKGAEAGIGFGEALGAFIEREECGPMPNKDLSVFARAVRLGIPITVHKGIGYDITDQHPTADFAALGKTSGEDFLIFANAVSRLEGGVFLNLGSSVMGPEVYLKALSMARNLAAQEDREISRFTTAVVDLVPLGNWKEEPDIVDYKKPGALSDPRYYFRPLKSILVRTVREDGRSFYIQGDFKQVVPALYHEIVALGERK